MNINRIIYFTIIFLILSVTTAISGQVTSADEAPEAEKKKINLIDIESYEIEDIIENENEVDGPETLYIETEFLKIKFNAYGAKVTSLQHKDENSTLKNNIEIAKKEFPFEFYPARNPETYRNAVNEINSIFQNFLLAAKDISTIKNSLKQKFDKLNYASSANLSNLLSDLEKEIEELPEQKANALSLQTDLSKKIKEMLANAGSFSRNMIQLTAETKKKLLNKKYQLIKTDFDGGFQVKAILPLTAVIKDAKLPIKFIKEFIFYNNSHYWEFSWKIENYSDKQIKISHFFFHPVSQIGPPPKSSSAREQHSFLNFYYSDESFKSEPTFNEDGASSFFSCACSSGSSEFQNIRSSIDFFGGSSRFMVMTFQPLDKNAGLFLLPYKLPKEEQNADNNKHAYEMQMQTRSVVIPSKSSTALRFLVYSGPKVKEFTKPTSAQINAHPNLKKTHPELNKGFDFGWTAPIRDLIVGILSLLYKLIPNYGIGIIIFGLLFKAVFYPLNEKQAKSMKKMQALQPLMKEINEKYKDNQQEKQRKTMELYRKHKVNPVSGCLPMLIQLPIFIALYSAFSDAYELWKSPFIAGWINDLSEPDTIYIFKSLPLLGDFHLNILPLVMGLTQFYQTKITMVSGDASQKKIMQLMPLVLLFVFWHMPAGVVLYWTINNILSVLQQIYTNKRTDKSNN
ncbi:MAG: membrane protein insertase YidC [Spirochaetia bacterium]|nr:membrane protein insertase YidC [Spirochaetia bacterium]